MILFPAELSSAGMECGAQSVVTQSSPPGVRRMVRWSAETWATVEPSTPFCRTGKRDIYMSNFGHSFQAVNFLGSPACHEGRKHPPCMGIKTFLLGK